MPEVYIIVKEMNNGHTDYQVWINKKKAYSHAGTLRGCYDVKDVRIHVGPIMDASAWAN